jgi:hypothetical protein
MIDELVLAATADERKEALNVDGVAPDDGPAGGLAGTAVGGHDQMRARQHWWRHSCRSGRRDCGVRHAFLLGSRR